MNILIISHEFPPIGGGGANACFFLIKEYVGLGHNVTVLTSQYKQCKKEEEIEGAFIIRVKALRENKEKCNFLEMFTFLISALNKAKKIVKDSHYDICQVFFGIPSGPIALYLKKKYKIPYIIRFGGGDIPGAQKRFTIIYKLLAPIIRSIWKNAEYLVANSEGLRQRAEAFDGRYPINIISNGVDIDFYAQKHQTINKDIEQVEILFVSRLIEGKGLQDIIPFMDEISSRAGKNVFLRIVGDGPFRTELERMVQKENLQEQVIFEGRKSKEELLFYYQNADLFILPSRSEGMPNVVLEAMAAGLPVIMTPCEGSKELVTDNGYIELFPQFIDKVSKLCGSDELRKKMGANSIKNIQRDFIWSEKAKQYVELMKRCLGEE